MARALRILLIDDDDDDRTLFGIALRRCAPEYFHCIATGAEHAIQVLEGSLKEKRPLPDLLLVDLKMPGMNGFDFLAWLKQHQTLCSLPAIVLSGSTLQTDVDRAYFLGARAYIYKPLKIEDLMENLKSFLGFWSQSAPL